MEWREVVGQSVLPFLLGLLGGLLALLAGVYAGLRSLRASRATARALLHEARTEAENKQREIVLAAQESSLALQAESDERQRELEEREAGLERRLHELEQRSGELSREESKLGRRRTQVDRLEAEAQVHAANARAELERAEKNLVRISGLTAEQARREIVAGIEADARAEASRLARKIEESARQNAERSAVAFMLRAAERVDIRDVVESTVSFIELPSDEMKGRIIGREGRNIRALEMATGIDLVVDDTPRSILISSFDPLRREIARVAIDKLVEDGRIHPARIEEVVARVKEEMETLVDERGREAAYALGISDLHSRIVKLVGRMRYRTNHGHNLLQHCRETALIAGHMAEEVGGRVEVAVRAGLLHEIGRADESLAGDPVLATADLAERFGEPDEVVETLRGLHSQAESSALESLLVRVASRMSDARPGARKENLAVFIERLRRLEDIATRFNGVERAYAVKAGKEIRVLVDAAVVEDGRIHELSREIARAVERDLAYPGQIKVNVIRETRAVRYAV